MVDINLLPWRKHTRRYQHKQMKMLLFASLLLSLLCVMGVYTGFAWQEKRARTRIAILKEDLRRIGVQKARFMPQEAGLSHGELKKWLNRAALTQAFFKALAHTGDVNVCFTRVSRNQNKVIFSGRARSSADLANFLIHWQAAALFSEIKIEKMEQHGYQSVAFRFQALE